VLALLAGYNGYVTCLDMLALLAGLRCCPSFLAGYSSYTGWITWLAVLAMMPVSAVYAGWL